MARQRSLRDLSRFLEISSKRYVEGNVPQVCAYILEVPPTHPIQNLECIVFSPDFCKHLGVNARCFQFLDSVGFYSAEHRFRCFEVSTPLENKRKTQAHCGTIRFEI